MLLKCSHNSHSQIVRKKKKPRRRVTEFVLNPASEGDVIGDIIVKDPEVENEILAKVIQVDHQKIQPNATMSPKSEKLQELPRPQLREFHLSRKCCEIEAP